MNHRTSPKTILLTGITGNLGAFASLYFLSKGYKVYALSRSKGGPDRCQRRVIKSLSEFIGSDGDLLTDELSRLEILKADITDGRSIASLDIPEPIDETWHFASSLKYMPKDRDEIYSVNLDGLTNIIDLHRRTQRKGAKFFYISTAYLGGKSMSRVPEARIANHENMSFNNYYESSKLLAENVFLDRIERRELEGAVFRPSIVIGARDTGRLVNFNGYYLVVKAWHGLCKSMSSLGPQNVVRVALDPETTMNLVPINDVIEVMGEISNSDLGDAVIFNLVNKSEVSLSEGFELLAQSVNNALRAVLCDPEEFISSPKSKYEKLISYALTYTSPYMKNQISFETGNVRRVLKRDLEVKVYPDLLNKITLQYVASLPD